MRLLLDTHALLWHHLGDPQLSRAARAAISAPGNHVLVSPATYREIAIKVAVGKYQLHVPFPDFIQEAIFDNGFTILPVEPHHAAALIGLPFHHRDPFDRLLVAQAMVENIPLVSGDANVAAYPVARIW